MRLQKYLAAAGLGSRRGCEEIIAEGRVTVNGSVATVGMSVAPGDQVRVDGKAISGESEAIYIALHKPIGYTSDHGSDAYNKSALDLIKLPQRLYPVGRLDKDSSGLLLVTNDGDLAYQLTHPKFEHEKEYHALVRGRPNDDTLRQWRNGVLLEGETERTARCEVSVIRQAAEVKRETAPVKRQMPAPRALTLAPHANAPSPLPFHERGETWLRIVLHEGRKRQIRRVGKLLGHSVQTLVRVRIGSLRLGDLQPGQWRQLREDEVKRLMKG